MIATNVPISCHTWYANCSGSRKARWGWWHRRNTEEEHGSVSSELLNEKLKVKIKNKNYWKSSDKTKCLWCGSKGAEVPLCMFDWPFQQRKSPQNSYWEAKAEPEEARTGCLSLGIVRTPHLVETNSSPKGSAIFHLADIIILYNQWLQQLGVKTPDVNPIRLKENLLAAIAGLKASKQIRDVLLAF